MMMGDVEWPPTADFACAPNENVDYVSIYVTPKGEGPQHYRLSKGGAEVLLAEISGTIADRLSTPTYDQCDTYVAGQYVFNYLRTFLAAAGIDASTCKLVIELPDRDKQRQLVSVLQQEAKGAPRSAARAGNHSGVWQGVEYEFSVKGLSTPTREVTETLDTAQTHAKVAVAIRDALADQDVEMSPPQTLYIAMKALDATKAALAHLQGTRDE